MRAKMIFVPREIDWSIAFPQANKTAFHFIVLSSGDLKCHICGKSLEEGNFASLVDSLPYKDKKKSQIWLFKKKAIAKQKGVKTLTDPLFRCPKCWNESKGINPHHVHHRIVIG